jgi:hypothetical protein
MTNYIVSQQSKVTAVVRYRGGFQLNNLEKGRIV